MTKLFVVRTAEQTECLDGFTAAFSRMGAEVTSTDSLPVRIPSGTELIIALVTSRFQCLEIVERAATLGHTLPLLIWCEGTMRSKDGQALRELYPNLRGILSGLRFPILESDVVSSVQLALTQTSAR